MKKNEGQEENKRKGKNFMAIVTKTISINPRYFLRTILLTFMKAAILMLAHYLEELCAHIVKIIVWKIKTYAG
jgi:hypothetical protein